MKKILANILFSLGFVEASSEEPITWHLTTKQNKTTNTHNKNTSNTVTYP